jgi:hypothetical protein
MSCPKTYEIYTADKNPPKAKASGTLKSLSACCCLLLQDLLQRCSRGGRGIVEDMLRYDEPSLVWTGFRERERVRELY